MAKANAKGPTKASSELARIKDEKQLSNGQMARLLSTEPQTVSRLVRGIRRPGLELAHRIAGQFLIPIEWWSRPPDDVRPDDEPQEATG